jgi:hypothetical protein
VVLDCPRQSRASATPSYFGYYLCASFVLSKLIESMDLKPPTNEPISTTSASTPVLAVATLTNFTCPICLDAPTSMTDVASISGCTHKFCFDCIDKWANTENRCPLCKSDFRTIDRVIAPSPDEDAPGISSNHSICRINTRTVVDRSQADDTPPSGALALFELAMFLTRIIGVEEEDILGFIIRVEDGELGIRLNTPSGSVDLLSILAAVSSQPDDSSQLGDSSESDNSWNASESGTSTMSGILMGIESLTNDHRS